MDYDISVFNDAIEKLKVAYTKKSNEVSRLIKENIRNNPFNNNRYSINKRTFVDAINSITALHDWIDSCYDVGINFDNCDVITKIEECLVDILCQCCNDSNDSDSEIAYFLYDMNSGRAFYPDTPECQPRTPEALWDWLKEEEVWKND